MHRDRGNISSDPVNLEKSNLSEWGSYVAALHSEEFEHPDYVLYLQVTPEVAIKRCKVRDRDGEKSYDPAYFKELCDVYSSVIPSSPAKGLQCVDWNADRTMEEIPHEILRQVKKLYDRTDSF